MYNKFTLIGFLGEDPQGGKNVEDGNFVCNFSVAVNPPNKAESEKPFWIHVAVWGDLGETCRKYLTKGRKVLIEGRLDYDRSTGGPKIFKRKDGTLGTAFEATAFVVEFLDSPEEKAGEGE